MFFFSFPGQTIVLDSGVRQLHCKDTNYLVALSPTSNSCVKHSNALCRGRRFFPPQLMYQERTVHFLTSFCTCTVFFPSPRFSQVSPSAPITGTISLGAGVSRGILCALLRIVQQPFLPVTRNGSFLVRIGDAAKIETAGTVDVSMHRRPIGNYASFS